MNVVLFGGMGARLIERLAPFATRGLFSVLAATKILKEKDITPELESHIYNRTLVVVREAQSRGVPMRVFTCFGRCTKFFSIEIDGARIVFDELPTVSIDGNDDWFSDKYVLKKKLKECGFPTPSGGLCRTIDESISVARHIGYPVVVKPACGSLSKHTTCGIDSDDDLRKGVQIAKIITNEFVVEEYIFGSVYRVTVVGGKVIGCCLREPPNVTGDGKKTLRELVDEKNTDPRRAPLSQKNSTLHHIAITAATHALLSGDGKTLESVPGNGEKIFLHSKVILGAGADIHDCTDQMHDDNKKLFEDAAILLGSPLIGFDALFSNIACSWRNQECGIIEANSKPYIDMHHVPVTGRPRNVAKALIDYLMNKTI